MKVIRNYREIGKQNNAFAWGGGKSQSEEGLIAQPKLFIAKRSQPFKSLSPQDNLAKPTMMYEVF